MGSGSYSDAVAPPPAMGSGSSARLAAEGTSAAHIRPLLHPDEKTVISTQVPVAAASSAPPALATELGKLLVGQRLEHFELRELVGGGGMGAVFRAFDTMLARPVAVKVLSKDQTLDEEAIRRFHNEAQSSARLDHENIARVYYIGFDKGYHYIVFEFIEGTNIRDLVQRRGPVGVADAVSYTLQAAHALAHASGRDVIHRDIKPSNLMVMPSGQVKLVDMGLSRLHQVEHSAGDLTASGVTLGTFDYISPEQARDPRGADVRSDIYSLGCTAYFMLTGRPPFPEGTVLQKLLQHQADEPPDPREFNPEVGEPLAAALRRMLAKNPEQRFQSAGELIAALTDLAADMGLEPHAPRGVIWTAPSSRRGAFLDRHLPWIAPIAGLLLVVLAIDLLGRWSNDNAAPRERPLAAAPSTGLSPTITDAAKTSAAKTTAAEPASKSASVAEAAKTANGVATIGKTPADDAKTTSVPAEKTSPATKTPAEVTPKKTTDTPPVEATPDASPTKTPAEPPAKTAATPEPPAANSPLVVGEAGPRERGFRTLAEAVAAAQNGDLIELRYDGPRVERPFATSLKLTLGAGKGFQPIVQFRPDDNGPLAPRGMIALAGGQLTVYDVAFEFDVPRDKPAEGWRLFEMQRSRLEADRCSFTVRYAPSQRWSPNQAVAVFDVRLAPGLAAMKMPDDPVPPPLRGDEVLLRDCVARGEAVLARVGDRRPFKLHWDNGLLATSEQLLRVVGSAAAGSPTDRVEIELRRLTAAMRGGLCLATTSPEAANVPDMEIDCRDCLFWAAPDTPLIEQYGMARPDVFRRQLAWNGDHNFFDGTTTLWKISGPDATNDPLQLSFSEWRQFWGDHETSSALGQVVWKTPPHGEQAMHERTLADFLLADRPADNPALTGATDRSPVGLRPDRLPRLPMPTSGEQTPD